MERVTVKCFKCKRPAEYKIRSWWLFGDWEWEAFACAEHANEWEDAFHRDQGEGRISHGMRYRITPLQQEERE